MTRSLGLLLKLTLLIAAVMLAGPLAAPSDAAEEELDLPGTALLAHYRATAFSYHEAGTLLWLVGPDGILRLEIRRADNTATGTDAWQPLLEQQGEGWTAIIAGHSDDTINAWGAQWRHPPAGLAQAAQLVTAALALGPPEAQGPKRWRAGQTAGQTTKYRVASLVDSTTSVLPGPPWRREQTARGLGRGGQDNVLVLKWVAEAVERPATLQVTASRSPGRLELELPIAAEVIYAMPEAFVPLWPLAQLMTFTP
jgi:hypothetical protein